MDFVVNLWHASPQLVVIGYALVGIIIWYIVIRIDYPNFREVVEDMRMVVPGGHARYREMLQKTPTGWVAQNGVTTQLFRDEETINDYLRHYPKMVIFYWLYHLSLLFLWPLLLTVLLGLILYGIVTQIAYGIWDKITDRY